MADLVKAKPQTAAEQQNDPQANSEKERKTEQRKSERSDDDRSKHQKEQNTHNEQETERIVNRLLAQYRTDYESQKDRQIEEKVWSFHYDKKEK